MNIKRTLPFILTILIDNIYNASLVTQPKFKESFIHVTNEKLQNNMNKLFSILKLKSDFTASPKIKQLLSLYYNLNNIVEYNWIVYNNNVKNSVKITENQNIDEFYKLIEVLNDNLTRVHDNNPNHNVTADVKLELTTTATKSFEKNIFTVGNNHTLAEIDINKLDAENTSRINDKVDIWLPDSDIENINQSLGNRRIFKGKAARIKKFPFVVSVHVMDKFTCTGSIISKDLVITAASCLQYAYKNDKLKDNTGSITVRIGSEYPDRYGMVIPVMEIFFHPHYESASLKNNLAMIRIRKHLKFSKKKRKIRRILHDRSAAALPRDVTGVIILGWGELDPLRPGYNHQLTAARLNIYRLEDCKDVYSKNYVTEKHFCAGFVLKSGGACNGDVGGPAIVAGVLVGVISFGPPICGTADAPTVITKLGYYCQWIEDIMDRVKHSPEKALINVVKYKIKQPMRIIPILHKTTKTLLPALNDQSMNEQIIRLRQDYPEEIKILREILSEIVLSNHSVIEKVIYDNIDDDLPDAFDVTPTEDLIHHPLVNKSLFLIPGIHVTEEPTQSPETLVPKPTGTIGIPNIPPELIPPYLFHSDEIAYFIEQYGGREGKTVKTTAPMFDDYYSNEITRHTRLAGTSELSDWYNNNDMSAADDSDGGMSIEIAPSSLSKKAVSVFGRPSKYRNRTRQMRPLSTNRRTTPTVVFELPYKSRSRPWSKRTRMTHTVPVFDIPYKYQNRTRPWSTKRITTRRYQNTYHNRKSTIRTKRPQHQKIKYTPLTETSSKDAWVDVIYANNLKQYTKEKVLPFGKTMVISDEEYDRSEN